MAVREAFFLSFFLSRLSNMCDENIQLRERFLQRFFSLSLSLFSQKEGVCDDDSLWGFVDSRIDAFLSLFLSLSPHATERVVVFFCLESKTRRCDR